MNMMIPLMIDFTGKKVIIFGGGEVAVRKAAYFTDGEVVVISRTFSDALKDMSLECRKVDLSEITEEEIRSLIRESFLVIAATSDQTINNRIGRACRRERVLFNNADGDRGDVILPATLNGKNFLVAVATYGRSPAFSRYLRSQLESSRDSFDRMIDLQEKLRTALKETIRTQEERSIILAEVMSNPMVWEALKESPSAAWNLVKKRYLG
jgi:precorrin-2 dehydrogenase/sirohydrochlorin ferrochelatase